MPQLVKPMPEIVKNWLHILRILGNFWQKVQFFEESAYCLCNVLLFSYLQAYFWFKELLHYFNNFWHGFNKLRRGFNGLK